MTEYRVMGRAANKQTEIIASPVNRASALEIMQLDREDQKLARYWVEQVGKVKMRYPRPKRIDFRGTRHISQPNLDAMTNYNPNGKTDARSVKRRLAHELTFAS